MLAPIPSRILRDTVIIQVPTGIDRYQAPQYAEYTVYRVHLQADDVTRKTAGNTEVTLKGTLYVDARLSYPALDWDTLQETAHKAGSQVTVEVINRRGKSSGSYTVAVVDGLPDDEDNLHHWEIGVV